MIPPKHQGILCCPAAQSPDTSASNLRTLHSQLPTNLCGPLLPTNLCSPHSLQPTFLRHLCGLTAPTTVPCQSHSVILVTMNSNNETSIPDKATQTPGPTKSSGAETIGERIRGLRRGENSKSIGKRVVSLSRMSRKHTSRPVTVSLKKPRKGATAKAVTVSSKKPKKGGAAAPRSATPLEPPRDDLSSFGSPVSLASRLKRAYLRCAIKHSIHLARTLSAFGSRRIRH